MQEASTLDLNAFDCVISPEGELNGSTTQKEQERFQAAMQATTGQSILLDLSRLTAIDSAGMSLVVGLFKDCNQADKKLQVAISSPFVIKVIEIMHLQRHIDFIKVPPL